MHLPVLKKEVLEYLDPRPGENFVDCTIGQGGHAIAILQKTDPDGNLLGIDRDIRQIESCRILTKNFEKRIILANDSYANLKDIVARNNFSKVRGILFDLGMSSWHLEESERGFSFQEDEVLDMRYGVGTHKLTAAEIVGQWTEAGLEKILREYGEERFAKRISRQIVSDRRVSPIVTTSQLVETIRRSLPAQHRKGKIHFATRTFQALRIAVNDELDNVKKALPQALEILEPQGKIVVISFHSLEDRIVKNFFKDSKVKILTKKPIIPNFSEIKNNPRSRSAKLRVATKI